MIAALLIEVFIKAFLLLILLYIVARDEADFDFRKVSMVTAAIVLGAVIMDGLLTRWIGLFAIVPIAVFTVFMVMQFCWVRFWRSLLVAIPFLVLNIMISTAVTGFHQKANSAIAKGLQGPVSEEDMKIALSFYQDGGRTNEFIAAALARRKAPKMEETLDQILLKKIIAGFAAKQFSSKAAGNAKTKGRPNINADSKPPAKEKKSAPEANPPQALDWRESAAKINVKGTLIGRDGVRVAIVNDAIIKEGECVRVEHKKTIYRWRAKLISESGVSWEPEEALGK
ncbi:MAG: hypothetical protein PHP98_09530 [Kiritimatiellae bacterium]|jgi:nitrogen regulatory protein PII-like uncharacterized protein|nr:hypothetical protein [Kiritimatiellia bacterium]